MGWIRVEDDFYDNDKMLSAGSIGRDLYWHGMAFCNRNLTDGLIPKSRALILVDFSDAAVLTGTHSGVDGMDCAPIAVARVLAAGLWHEDGHDCPDCVQPGPRHYVVHDYLKYQPSRADVEAKRDAAAERMRKARESRSRDVRANIEGTSPEVRLTPNPNPNPNKSLVTKGGGVTLRNARDVGGPRPVCRKHNDGNPNDDPCRACQRVREWDEANADRLAADELAAKREARERAEQCPVCHGTTWVPDTEPAIRCYHDATAAHA